MEWVIDSPLGPQLVRLEQKGAEWIARIGRATYPIRIVESGPTALSCIIGGQQITAEISRHNDNCHVVIDHMPFTFTVRRPSVVRGTQKSGGQRDLCAPMPSRVVEVHVKVGDRVTAGQSVLVVEAMKMQNELHAPTNGTILHMHVTVGQAVEARQPLLTVSCS